MKKLFSVLVALVLFPSLGMSIQLTTDFPNGITTCSPSQKGSLDTTLADGAAAFQGTLEVNGATRLDSTLRVDGGILTAHETFVDIDVASATAYDSHSISTTTLVSASTTTTSAADFDTNIIHPRNAVLVVDFLVGATTTTVTGTALITGVNARGAAATETLTVSTTSATGNVAWSSITSVAWTITAVSGRVDTDEALLKVGSGNKIGLCNDVVASADILNVIMNDSGTTADDKTYVVDTTYDTITFTTASDGTTDDYEVWYNADAK